MYNLLPDTLIEKMKLVLANGLGAYKVIQRDPGNNPQKVEYQYERVVMDLIMTYDTIALPVNSAANTIVKPNSDYTFFTGDSKIRYMDNITEVQYDRSINVNNVKGTQGGALPGNNAIAAIGMYYEFQPYLGLQFENWFLNMVQPSLKIKVGQRDYYRFEQKLKYFINHNALNGASTASSGAVNTMHMLAVYGNTQLPSQLWNLPLPINAKEKLEIVMDCSKVKTQVGNYVLTADQLTYLQGLSTLYCEVTVGLVGAFGRLAY